LFKQRIILLIIYINSASISSLIKTIHLLELNTHFDLNAELHPPSKTQQIQLSG